MHANKWYNIIVSSNYILMLCTSNWYEHH